MNHTTTPEKAFSAAISSLIALNADAKQFIRKHQRVKIFSPKESLTSTEPFYHGLYYLYSGLARCYFRDAYNRDITDSFTWEGQFLPLTSSGTTEEGPLDGTLEFLEEAIVVGLSAADLAELHRLYPASWALLSELTNRQLAEYKAWARAFRRYPKGELPDWFFAKFPQLVGRVSGKHLASFVGLAPESLSRLRGKKK